jgi:hypothetical protein
MRCAHLSRPLVLLCCVALTCVSALAQSADSVERPGPDTVRVAEQVTDVPRDSEFARFTASRDSVIDEALHVAVRDGHVVAFSSTGQVVVTVVDTRGGEHAQKSDERGQLALDLHPLNSGVYFVSVVSNGRRKTITITR